MGSLTELEFQSMMMKRKKKEMERYIVCLEEEMRKIEVFRRELPLSMQLLSSVIQTSKKELRDCNENEQLVRAKGRLQLDPAPHDQAKAPELDPRKTFTFWTPDQAYDHAEKILQSMTNPHKKHMLEVVRSSGERPCSIDCPINDSCGLTPPYPGDVSPFSRDKHRTEFSLVFSKDRRQGAFSPFLPKDGTRTSSNVESGENPSSLTLNEDYISHQESLSHSVDDRLDHSMSSRDDEEPNMKLEEGNIKNAPILLSLNSGKNCRHSSKRKQRRCWSPELHRKFIKALQHLGGPRVATPKLIRELMNVDGLTNDEVKSHLQKHRLNARRPNRSSKLNGNSPQLVLLGGVWVPHDSNDIQHDEREHIYNNVLNPPLSEGSLEEISCAPMHTFIK